MLMLMLLLRNTGATGTDAVPYIAATSLLREKKTPTPLVLLHDCQPQ